MVSSHLMSTAQTFSQVHSILITSNSPCSVRPLLLKLWQETQKSETKKKGFVFNLCACFFALQNRGVAEMGKWRVNRNYLTHLRMLSFGRAARKLLTPSSPSWLLDKLGAKRKGVNVLPFLGGVLWQCVCVCVGHTPDHTGGMSAAGCRSVYSCFHCSWWSGSFWPDRRRNKHTVRACKSYSTHFSVYFHIFISL